MFTDSGAPCVHHVIVTAGHDRHVFNDPAFFADFWGRLPAFASDGCRVYCYAFMSAHLHMTVESADCPTLSDGMMRLLGPVAWSANARAREVGAIFTHPFYRKRVLSRAHLHELALYIPANPSPLLNPRADFGARTSFRAWVTGEREGWLFPEPLLSDLGGPAAFAADFHDYLRSRRRWDVPELDPEVEVALRLVGRRRGCQIGALLNPRRGAKEDRKVAVWTVLQTTMRSPSYVARLFGTKTSTVCRWADEVRVSPAFCDDRTHLASAIGAFTR